MSCTILITGSNGLLGQKLLYKVAPDIKGKRPRGQETGTESRGISPRVYVPLLSVSQ